MLTELIEESVSLPGYVGRNVFERVAQAVPFIEQYPRTIKRALLCGFNGPNYILVRHARGCRSGMLLCMLIQAVSVSHELRWTIIEGVVNSMKAEVFLICYLRINMLE